MTWGLALARATRPRRRVRGGAVMALGRHQPIGSTDALKGLGVMPRQVVQPADGWQATEG